MPGTDKLLPFVQFFVVGKVCEKYPLDKVFRPKGRRIPPAGIPVNFFEKGVDFLGKVRYNLFLHKGHSMPGRIFEQEV